MEYSPFVAGVNQGQADSSEDQTSQWVMLARNNGEAYAQIGWIEDPGGVTSQGPGPPATRNIFAQFFDQPAGAYWTNYWPAPDINSNVEYEMTYDPTCSDNDCFAFDANGETMTHSHLNFDPFSAQVEEELHDQASQLPGVLRGTLGETNDIQAYSPSGSGSWANQNVTPYTLDAGPAGTDDNAGPAWMNIAPSSATDSFETWDGAC